MQRRPNLFKTFFLVLFILWIFAAAVLSVQHIRFTALVCDLFWGKTEEQKLQIVERGLYPALAACREGTPADAEILILVPRGRKIRKYAFDYYLYPRRITWMEKKDGLDIPSFCRSEGIGYYLVYDALNAPLLKRVD